MLAISRMKALLQPKLSALSPHLPKPRAKTTPFTVVSWASESIIPINPIPWASESFILRNPIRIPNHLHLKSTPLYKNFVCSAQNRNLHMEASQPPFGEIHVIIGPMFAGKTTTLLRRIQLESSNGRNVAIIKSSKDIRYGLDSIVTHDGDKLPCWALSNLSSFRQKFGLDAYEKLDVIGIDEAQFFEDLYDFCREAADHDGKVVIVAGLDGDYLRKSFGSVLDIIPLADSVTKLTARCELCGKRAFFTLRKTDETQVELIGGADVYMPVCRQHYVSGQIAMETAKHVLESHKIECGSHVMNC